MYWKYIIVFWFFYDFLIVYLNYLLNMLLNYMVILIECGVDIFSGFCLYLIVVVCKYLLWIFKDIECLICKLGFLFVY